MLAGSERLMRNVLAALPPANGKPKISSTTTA